MAVRCFAHTTISLAKKTSFLRQTTAAQKYSCINLKVWLNLKTEKCMTDIMIDKRMVFRLP